MIREWINIVRELYRKEGKLVLESRINGLKVPRVSTVLFIMFAILYAFSPLDLLPELLIESDFAYFDDVIVVILMLFFAYKDIGGLLENEQRNISDINIQPTIKSEGKDNIPVEDEPLETDIDIIVPNDSSINSGDKTGELLGNPDDDIFNNFFSSNGDD